MLAANISQTSKILPFSGLARSLFKCVNQCRPNTVWRNASRNTVRDHLVVGKLHSFTVFQQQDIESHMIDT